MTKGKPIAMLNAQDLQAGRNTAGIWVLVRFFFWRNWIFWMRWRIPRSEKLLQLKIILETLPDLARRCCFCTLCASLRGLACRFSEKCLPFGKFKFQEFPFVRLARLQDSFCLFCILDSDGYH